MKIKSLLLSAATLFVATAQVNAQEAYEASVKWTMGSADISTLSATTNPADVFESAIVTAKTEYTHSDNKTTSLGKRTAKPSEELQIPLTSIKNVPISKDDNVYFQFEIKAAQNFKPTSFSVDAWGVKAGSLRFDVIAESANTQYVIKEGQAAARTQEDYNNSNESKSGYTFSYNITGIEATTENIIIKIYPYTSDSSTSREIGIANVIISGKYYEGDAPVVPTIPEGAVVAPLATGTYYDLTKTDHNGIATVGPNDVGNTFKGTVVNFPFYLEEEANIYFYLEQGAKERSNGYLLVSLDGELVGEHEVVITGNWSTYSAVSVFRLENLSAGKHVVTVARDDDRCTESYAGNWRVSFHAEDVYSFAPVNLATGIYAGGCRTENDHTNVGYIKTGASAEYRVYVPETGVYEMQIGISNSGGGTCKVTVKEEDIETSFETALASRAYGDVRQISLGEIKTPGIKTLRLDFSADHTGYIANYDNLSLVRTGDLSGVTDIEAAEVVAVEYYNLQGVRVEAGACGTLIRVSTDANGSRKADKVIVR